MKNTDKKEGKPTRLLRRIFRRMSPKKELTIFISHASKEKYYVELLSKALQSVGIVPWVDQQYLMAGDVFSDRIFDAINSSEAVLVLWSREASASEWVRSEFLFAIQHGKRVIPCVTDVSSLPKELSHLHYADFIRDVQGGLAQLMSTLGLQIPSTSFVKDYIRILFDKVLSFKLEREQPHNQKIPGVELECYDQKLLRWKNRAYPSFIGIATLSRSFLQENYGDDLDSLFRAYLTGNGWEYQTLASDHYGQLQYRTLTICCKGIKTFTYMFVAKQKGSDWVSQLYILHIDHRIFFEDVLEWLERDEPLTGIADNFVVVMSNPTVNIPYYGIELSCSLSFQCDLGTEALIEGIEIFEQLLPLFSEYIEGKGYKLIDIGFDKAPLFEVITADTIHLPRQEEYLYEAIPQKPGGKQFQFLFESKCNGDRTSGYSRISIVRTPNQRGYFTEILACFENLGKGIVLPSSDYFHANIYSEGEFVIELAAMQVSSRMAFYCEHGRNATKGGEYYYRALLPLFAQFLQESDYRIEEVKTESYPGWTKVLYSVSHVEKRNFSLIYEAEQNRGGTMGYSKIHLCYA